MILKEYIKTVMSNILKEDKNLPDREIMGFLKRILSDIGKEELSWFVRDQDSRGLTQQILEMIHYGFPHKPQKWVQLIASKDYESICKLIQFAVEAATGANLKCSPKVVEHFFYSIKTGI